MVTHVFKTILSQVRTVRFQIGEWVFDWTNV